MQSVINEELVRGDDVYSPMSKRVRNLEAEFYRNNLHISEDYEIEMLLNFETLLTHKLQQFLQRHYRYSDFTEGVLKSGLIVLQYLLQNICVSCSCITTNNFQGTDALYVICGKYKTLLLEPLQSNSHLHNLFIQDLL